MTRFDREKHVDKMWEMVVTETMHGISTPNPHLVNAVMHEEALHRRVIAEAWDRGELACRAGKAHTSNPYDVEGLSVFGVACQAAWSSGFLSVKQPQT